MAAERRQADKTGLNATRATISQVLTSAEAQLQTLDRGASAATVGDVAAVEAGLRRIAGIRASADAGTISPAGAFQAYSDIIDAQFQAYYAATLDRGAALQAAGIGTIDGTLALEMASREAALLDGALLIGQGQLDPAARTLFTSSATSRQLLTSQALSVLPPGMRGTYAAITASPAYQRFTTLESQVTASAPGKPVPVDPTVWNQSSGAVLQAMLKAETSNAAELSAMSAHESNRLLTEAILAGGVGLLAVAVSVFLLFWFGRKVTGDLTRLYSSVRGMAEERLPRVVERLRRGDDVDVAAESPPPAASGIAEISQIARSFGTVQEAAVAAAVEQARLRAGVNQVFLNISLRNQSLLHRQLAMLDTMERRTSEPGELADLFRLDHLTTRMRRHAEGLIILSGATPGRGWRDPVPVVDVLRAAVAEVEDYVRVDVVSESRDLVAGTAVGDLIHLVAELVENATVFSPPSTRIEVSADRAAAGLVVEVVDRGLGLSAAEFEDINRRLASPPEFDPAGSEQLGLFVVSRLAARHALRVSLRPSPYGGTTAILLVPFGVIVRAEEAPAPARADGSPSGPAATTWPPLPPAREPGRDTGPEPTFGATGRHQAPTALTLPPPPPPPPVPPAAPPGPWAGRPAAPPVRPPAPPAGRPLWDANATPWFDAFTRPAAVPSAGPAPAPGEPAEDDGQPGRGQPGEGQRAEDRPLQGPEEPGRHLGLRSGSPRPAWRRNCGARTPPAARPPSRRDRAAVRGRRRRPAT